jgi:hypothetical protein
MKKKNSLPTYLPTTLRVGLQKGKHNFLRLALIIVRKGQIVKQQNKIHLSLHSLKLSLSS